MLPKACHQTQNYQTTFHITFFLVVISTCPFVHFTEVVLAIVPSTYSSQLFPSVLKYTSCALKMLHVNEFPQDYKKYHTAFIFSSAEGEKTARTAQ
jgi:hypothetical protein